MHRPLGKDNTAESSVSQEVSYLTKLMVFKDVTEPMKLSVYVKKKLEWVSSSWKS